MEDISDIIKKIGKGNILYYVKELNKWVSSQRMSKELSKIGSNTQLWYDSNILRIQSFNSRPKCKLPGCENECRFIDISHGYRDTCCTDHGNKLASLNRQSYWSTHEEEKKNVYKKLSSNDKWRENLSKAQKRIRDKDPILYSEIKRKSRLKALENNPDLCKNHSNYMKSYYSNEENRIKTSQAIKNRYKRDLDLHRKISERTKNSLNTEESRMKRSKSHIDLWKNPTEKMINPKGGSGFRGIKSRIYSPYEDKFISFDSNWERDFFINISNNPDVIKIIRGAGMSIGYINPNDGISHNYIPDFLIEYSNGYKEVVEIKPQLIVDTDEIVNIKYRYAIKYLSDKNIGYRFITEKNYKFT